MTAFNIVRMRVKPEREEEYLALNREMVTPGPGTGFNGLRRIAVVKSGDRSYCLVGEWDSFDAIVAARPAMIAQLDRMRDLLEDLGGDLGVTDPISGEAVLDSPLAAPKRASAPRKRPAKKPAASRTARKPATRQSTRKPATSRSTRAAKPASRKTARSGKAAGAKKPRRPTRGSTRR